MLGSAFTIGAADAMGEPPRTDADLRGVTPDYFKAMDIRLVEGRAFTPGDTAQSPPVAIVDETFARRVAGTGRIIGQRIRWIRRPGDAIEIVGVVRAVRHRGFEQPARETVYRPTTQYSRNTMFVVAATAGDASRSAGAVAAAVGAVDPDQPVADVATIDDLVDRSLAQPGFGAAFGAALALLALGLAVVGVYGLFAFAVAGRTREIGVRLALGATSSRVVRLIVAEGAAVAGAGLAAGLSGAVIAARWIRTVLPGALPIDLSTIAVAGGVMLAAALAACWLPARRAGRLDPASVIRSE